jgi:hypothetical protein
MSCLFLFVSMHFCLQGMHDLVEDISLNTQIKTE